MVRLQQTKLTSILGRSPHSTTSRRRIESAASSTSGDGAGRRHIGSRRSRQRGRSTLSQIGDALTVPQIRLVANLIRGEENIQSQYYEKQWHNTSVRPSVNNFRQSYLSRSKKARACLAAAKRIVNTLRWLSLIQLLPKSSETHKTKMPAMSTIFLL